MPVPPLHEISNPMLSSLCFCVSAVLSGGQGICVHLCDLWANVPFYVHMRSSTWYVDSFVWCWRLCATLASLRLCGSQVAPVQQIFKPWNVLSGGWLDVHTFTPSYLSRCPSGNAPLTNYRLPTNQ